MGKVTELPSVRPGISPPEPINARHDVSAFDSGEISLDTWLREQAVASEGRSARTYVISADRVVIGYYTLCAGSVSHDEAPGRIRRNTPDPIPVVILARLAITRAHQRRNLGAFLLREVFATTAVAAQQVGMRAILVHALNEDAKRFYLRYGFIETALDARTLVIPIETVIRAL